MLPSFLGNASGGVVATILTLQSIVEVALASLGIFIFASKGREKSIKYQGFAGTIAVLFVAAIVVTVLLVVVLLIDLFSRVVGIAGV